MGGWMAERMVECRQPQCSDPVEIRDQILECVHVFMSDAQFPPTSAGDSKITIPLIFE